MTTIKNIAALAVCAALAAGTIVHAETLTCPVTKLSIASPKAAVGKSTYKHKTYYFCTSNCKMLFDKNPAKFAGKSH
ncbi:hypothetical protein CCAX7_51390 [Capsulimonas corticalis]|uniref:YHS domain-containing protein n=1 Tax=Capsulimonas corticalis TaxID=2219043 RepID=A0A402CPA3_9BACT|nr:YHS domain-containing protein [Capsulimonas corticalis]BDI33088.1 hypothetical protein CCAX7_51390 [Capsulimonas corticalis]